MKRTPPNLLCLDPTAPARADDGQSYPKQRRLDGVRALGSRHGHAARWQPNPWPLADCAKSISGTWHSMPLPEMSRSICLDSCPELISIVGQPVPIAASRCYLIQMLRSALTCTNGCSCWSPDEENNPRNFPYHGCALPTELGGQVTVLQLDVSIIAAMLMKEATLIVNASAAGTAVGYWKRLPFWWSRWSRRADRGAA